MLVATTRSMHRGNLSPRPDPKPQPRVRDFALLHRLHYTDRVCALADDTCEPFLSLHHIHRHPRDDVAGNLVMLCGDGTRGHHGRVEGRDCRTIALLGHHLRYERPDFLEYLTAKLGAVGANEWMARYL